MNIFEHRLHFHLSFYFLSVVAEKYTEYLLPLLTKDYVTISVNEKQSN